MKHKVEIKHKSLFKLIPALDYNLFAEDRPSSRDGNSTFKNRSTFYNKINGVRQLITINREEIKVH